MSSLSQTHGFLCLQSFSNCGSVVFGLLLAKLTCGVARWLSVLSTRISQGFWQCLRQVALAKLTCGVARWLSVLSTRISQGFWQCLCQVALAKLTCGVARWLSVLSARISQGFWQCLCQVALAKLTCGAARWLSVLSTRISEGLWQCLCQVALAKLTARTYTGIWCCVFAPRPVQRLTIILEGLLRLVRHASSKVGHILNEMGKFPRVLA